MGHLHVRECGGVRVPTRCIRDCSTGEGVGCEHRRGHHTGEMNGLGDVEGDRPRSAVCRVR